jgi:uncharacterized protein
MDIIKTLTKEINASPSQVSTSIQLLDGGATVPFISRYRKEATGGLTDTQLRDLEERLHYLRELGDRKSTILKSIEEQGKLTPPLKQAIESANNKASLEDLYLPYKPKRRTKAQIAIEAGLELLATQLFNDPTLNPETLAETFINTENGVPDSSKALEGARHILMESFAENAELLGELREYVWKNSQIISQVAKDKEKEGIKFSDYFAYQESLCKVPSHRALALFRGRRESILRISITLEDDQNSECIDQIAHQFKITNEKRPADTWLAETIRWTWRIKIFTKLELECMMRLKEAAESEAIKVFTNNLKNLLMTAPAGSRTTIGLDPGLRTGVKVVVIDNTGKLLDHTTIFPHVPRNQWDQSINTLAKLAKKHQADLISIGNGTASRETDALAADLCKLHPSLNLTRVMVSEAGASVYSASKLAAEEFPDIDVTIRGAVSIARRLQDPLAELVKIEPKSIGVGQYQHDVNQVKLGRSLKSVVEDCVNAVGVDVNTASAPLLTSVAGLTDSIAKNIIEYRDKQGAFTRRESLKKVARLGEKAYEQAAGFLRIVGGDNPLDASAVHPEAYPIVEKILEDQSKTLHEIMGNHEVIRKLSPVKYASDKFGEPTITDIIAELDKPGRDPRPEFKTAKFKDGVDTIADLKSGMMLEGVVTNVANFGAFVDIGVHQDGLVHKSVMVDHFVKDPSEIVKVGDIVQVKVVEIDVERKRISLSMRLNEQRQAKPGKQTKKTNTAGTKQKTRRRTEQLMNNALASAFSDALTKLKNK